MKVKSAVKQWCTFRYGRLLTLLGENAGTVVDLNGGGGLAKFEQESYLKDRRSQKKPG